MARVTVEDCLEQIDNRFDLVLVAARRAHMLRNGAGELLDWDNDKPAVLALREIAAGKVGRDILDLPLNMAEEGDGESDVEDMHRRAAETVVQEKSATQEDEDFDEDYGGEREEDGETASAEAEAPDKSEDTAPAEPDASTTGA